MSFDLTKEISDISNDIKEDESQLKKLDSIYNQIPKNIIINNNKKENIQKNDLNSLINSFNIIEQIDKIKECLDTKEKLNLIKTLFTTTEISNSYLKQLIITSLISEDILIQIKKILLDINYPMFKGKILLTIFDQLSTDKKEDMKILSLYFEIFSYISNDIYKEFDNYDYIDKLLLKNKENNNDNNFYFMEMITNILYKKILATIFDSDANKNNNMKKIV